MSIIIYHNPNCSTSRNVTEFIRQTGIELNIILYLKNPPTKEKLKELIHKMAVPVRAILRKKEVLYAELDLGNPKWSENELIDFIVQYPILMNRPIVETEDRAKLCRPFETIQDFLGED